MKAINLQFLIVSSILILSCNSNTTEKSEQVAKDGLEVKINIPIHLEFEKLIENKKEVFLSDIVSEIEYIKLETTPAYLIGDKSVQVSVTDSLVIVIEHGKPVGVFSRNGEFLREVGKIGRGPGEYDFDTLFRLENDKGHICVWNAMRGSIMVFDLMGKFIDEFKPECKPSSFGYAGNNVFVTTQFKRGRQDTILPKFVVFNDKGETLNRVYASTKDPARKGGGIVIMLPSYYDAPGGVIINTYENDTIFKVFPDGSLTNAVTWNSGHLKVPYDILLEYSRFKKEGERYLTQVECMESNKYWLISYNYQGNFNMALYNKNDKSFNVVSNPDYDLNGVINDIDGGPSFWPRYNNTEGRIFIDILYPTQLKRWYDEGRFERDNVLFPDKKKHFIDMVRNLDLDDNPVLMLVTFK